MNIGEKIEIVADAVYEKGKQTQFNNFWDRYLNEDVVTTNVSHMQKFSGIGWNDDTFYPTKDLKVGYGYMWFMYNRVTNIKQRLIDCGVKLDFSNASDLGSFYEGCVSSEVPEIDLTNVSRSTGAQRLFYECKKLITIDKIRTKNTIAYGNDFIGCVALENLGWDGIIGKSIDIGDSTKLTTESIVNTFEHLGADTVDETLSLSKIAVDNMVFPFTSNESGITYNSWDELITTKSNWTVALIT